jgi:hypothetical protein
MPIQTDSEPATRARSLTAAPFFLPAVIFAVNSYVAWRLFRVEYLDQLPSVEGEFIAMARYIQSHWPGYDWQSLWYAGYPVVRTYQPLVHYAVAALASLCRISPAASFHFIGAVSYSLGGVAFYYLARNLSGNRVLAFAGGLGFSLFSPSGVLVSGIRADMGSVWNARRLQALVVYGELPNLTGLMLGMFALGVLHRALARRTPGSTLAASLLIAAVPATNWPSTVALTLAILCYVAALSRQELADSLPRIGLILLMGTVFALPFALPSTIFATYGNANVMVDLPTHGPRRWLTVAMLVACGCLLRFLLGRFRSSFGMRFAALWLNVLGWIVLSSTTAGIAILPLPLRFHIALEIPLTLTATFILGEFFGWFQANRRLILVCFALLCCLQAYHYKRFARSIIRRLEITHTVEYEEATWLSANMAGERVLMPGSIQFWLNAFATNPQMTGCCDQSVLNHENMIAGYVTSAGYQSDAESADYSILWMKAYAVGAVSIGGPQSRESYRQYPFKYRYHGRLPLLWARGDDYIFGVPERVRGLARVVGTRDLVLHPPASGIDAVELRKFVSALDNPSLPVASWHWNDVNSASIDASIAPDQVIAVALNYHPGWSASVAGKRVRLRPDGMGMIVIQPGCTGPCVVEMHWSPGVEPWIVVPSAILTFGLALLWCYYDGRKRV